MTNLLKDEVQLFKLTKESLNSKIEYMNELQTLRERTWNYIKEIANMNRLSRESDDEVVIEILKQETSEAYAVLD